MKLSPLDIRKHEFGRKLRGYDPEEVRPFLEMLSEQWEEMQEDLRQARDRARELEGKIGHYEKVEVALQEALESARNSAKKTQLHAEERARLVLEEAELKAEQILRDADQQRYRLRQQVSSLTHRQAEITARLRHFLMSELEILAQHEEEKPIGFMKLIPARDPAPDAEPLLSRPAAALDVPDDEEAAPDQPEATDSETSDAAEPAGTTYADMYARAARRARDEEPAPEPAEDADPSAEEEDTNWILRALVEEDREAEQDRPAPHRDQSPEDDRIRRIVFDQD